MRTGGGERGQGREAEAEPGSTGDAACWGRGAGREEDAAAASGAGRRHAPFTAPHGGPRPPYDRRSASSRSARPGGDGRERRRRTLGLGGRRVPLKEAGAGGWGAGRHDLGRMAAVPWSLLNRFLRWGRGSYRLGVQRRPWLPGAAGRGRPAHRAEAGAAVRPSSPPPPCETTSLALLTPPPPPLRTARTRFL